jgi:hypothetical protein
MSHFDGILSAAGRRSNDLLKSALFCGLPGVASGISALSLEIRIISWKFKKSADFSDFQQIFYFSSWKFRFPAGKFFFQLVF